LLDVLNDDDEDATKIVIPSFALSSDLTGTFEEIQDTMWRRIYLLLVLVRLYFALQPSYLHPDENFQGPEIIAGMLEALV
jgi:hypothetical protein